METKKHYINDRLRQIVRSSRDYRIIMDDVQEYVDAAIARSMGVTPPLNKRSVEPANKPVPAEVLEQVVSPQSETKGRVK